MEVLVLGGTRFVGRWIVDAAVRREHSVTVVNRGQTGTDRPEVRSIHVDRRDAHALHRALRGGEWDVVFDTWAQEPVVVRDSARLLRDRARQYTYVSSRSVYKWPIPHHIDEGAALVTADPGGTDSVDYAVAKRGSEVAVLDSFDGRGLLARAGLILGPYEDVGRLPWWLGRLHRGGRVPAPGPRGRPLQYIDVRDLAGWLVRAAERGLSGAFNVVSRPGHTTMGELLDVCARTVGGGAELVWVPPEVIEAVGVSGWTDLPIWVPPEGELAALHDADVSAAMLAGLTCRPVTETVADTWSWILRDGFPEHKPDRPPLGLSPEAERALLRALDGQ